MKTNNLKTKILAILMLVVVLFAFMPINVLISYAIDGLNTVEPCEQHDWSNEDGICAVCSTECTHSYNVETATCSTCGKICTHKDSNDKSTYASKLTSATCTEAGELKYTCSVCGNEKTTETKALGHSFTNYVSNNDAKCNMDGTETATCDRENCNVTDTKTIVGSSANVDHTWDATTGKCTVCEATCTHETTEIQDAVAETCTAKGATGNTVCTVCGYITVATQEIQMKAHDYGTFVIDTKPTCTANGSMSRHCANCTEKTDVTEISATGHDWSNKDGICTVCDTTCSHDSWENATCTTCGKVCDHEGKWNATTGKCTVCLTECQHASWENATCTTCGKVCDHEDKWNAENGTCNLCGTECTHASWKNATCTTCGKVCDHEGKWSAENGTCTVCSTECTHANKAVDQTTANSENCTEAGNEANEVCPTCGKVTSAGQTINATGHDWSNKDGICKTCSEPCTHTNGAVSAWSKSNCTICGKVCDHEGEWDADKGTCSVCGTACTHNYGDPVEQNNATCTKAGTTVETCSICENEKVETSKTVLATGTHKYDKTKADGKCTMCEQETCDHTGAVIDQTTVKEESCTEKGYTGDTVCPTCGKVTETGSEKDMKAHEYDTDEGTGKCTVCKQETCEHTTNSAPIYTAETCTEAGSIVIKCADCGKIVTNQEVPAAGHDYGEYVSNNDETCLADGTKTRTCSVCKKTETIDNEGSAKGHSYNNYVSNGNATCLEDGTKTAQCENGCGIPDTIEDERSALGHDYAAGYTTDTEPTCTSEGKASKHCSRCDVTEGEITLSKLDHVYSTKFETITPATCTENQTVGYKCTTCPKGEEAYNTDSVITIENSATGHKYGNVVTKATCTTDGYTTYTCSACGDEYTADEVKASGHKYNNVVTKATCTAKGYTTYTCSVCGDKYTADEVKALGHKLNTVTTKATTKVNGSIVTKCNVCGTVTKTEKIAKIASVKLSTTTYTYNGNAKKPTVTVKDGNGNVIASKNYTVTYKNNKNIGKATVTITFKGNYSGTVTRTFTINPAKVTGVKTSKTTKNSITLKWNKVDGNVTGYRVYVWNSAKKSYKYYGTTKTNSITVKSLSGKTTCRFRVKAYKTVSGKQYVGAYSDIFKATTK